MCKDPQVWIARGIFSFFHSLNHGLTVACLQWGLRTTKNLNVREDDLKRPYFHVERVYLKTSQDIYKQKLLSLKCGSYREEIPFKQADFSQACLLGAFADIIVGVQGARNPRRSNTPSPNVRDHLTDTEKQQFDEVVGHLQSTQGEGGVAGALEKLHEKVQDLMLSFASERDEEGEDEEEE